MVLCLSEGQLSDHVGAKLIYPAMPNAKVLIGDKGYDSDEFRDALKARKIKANWSEQRPSARTSVRFPVISAQKGAAGVRPQVDHCARGPIDHNQCIRPDPTQMHHPKG